MPLQKILGKFYEVRADNKCPVCECDVTKQVFRDELSQKEFRISGLCQKCQDNIFSE